jgi:hypothetical protein
MGRKSSKLFVGMDVHSLRCCRLGKLRMPRTTSLLDVGRSTK